MKRYCKATFNSSCCATHHIPITLSSLPYPCTSILTPTTFRELPLADAGAFHHDLGQLRKQETVRPKDLNLQPPLLPHQGPPLTYRHICETECFSMGVLLLQGGACTPLHDHPGMHSLLKVLYGILAIKYFDKEEAAAAAAGARALGVRFNPPLLKCQRAALRRLLLNSSAVLNEASGPCLLTPLHSNMHQTDALDGPASFLDILALPYDPDMGRDYHYFKVLQESVAKASPGAPQPQQQEAMKYEL